MFSVTIRDHIMIAHSLRGEVFGPAQRLHGATYVVDATFRRASLDGDGIVVDIGRATEVLAWFVADELAERAKAGGLGESAETLDGIAVRLAESHVAWAGYERTL